MEKLKKLKGLKRPLSRKPKGAKRKPDAFPKDCWLLEALENSFCFTWTGKEKKEPLYVEFDEILASGAAYELQDPQNVLELLERLEQAAPNFNGVHIREAGIYLNRVRSEDSKGLLISKGDGEKRFYRDPTLKTFNFYHFYFDITGITPNGTEKED